MRPTEMSEMASRKGVVDLLNARGRSRPIKIHI